MSRKPTEGIDYTSRDYEAFRELMVQELQRKMPEYTDTSETDAGIVILEAFANGLDILSLYLDIIANDVLLPTTQDRKLATVIANCLGYTPYNQTASVYPQVFVLGDVRKEDTLIPKGTVVTTKESSDLATLYFETMKDLVIPAGSLGNEQDKDGNYLYKVEVHHGSSVYQDVIGSSSGAPLQSFKLNYTGVLVDTLELFINEGNGQNLWTRVDSFLESDSNSMVYTVTVDEFDVCTVEFGNGLKGKIPTVYPNGIIANYRIGGGEVGNVSAGIITELNSSVAYIDSCFNLEAIVKGHDKEGIDSIRENAPATYRTRNRLVTLGDYEDLLRINFYDLDRVKALRDIEDRKLVHLFYMMRNGYEMSADLVENIADFISSRQMVGTTYDLNPFVEQPVNLDCVLYIDNTYKAEELKDNVIAYLEGVTFSYGELQFGDVIIKSDLESEIKNMFSGILAFRINSPTEDIITPSSPQNVLTKGTVSITVKTL